ncbi:hypothetical protein BDQ17DRAFT_1341619 [Cyathus striatus]|nr:hypothetical protein BDQ17DRAFT_1341619 [Cyathus striatus]
MLSQSPARVHPESGWNGGASIKTSVKSYMAIERHLGLVSIGKRLMKHVEINPINFAWKKSLPEAHANAVLNDKKTLAMSAFMLASLPTPLDRKKMVNEMWESGAHTLVIIDHNTKAGLEAVAEAREYLLKMGRKELEVIEESTELESSELEDQAAELKTRSTHGSHVIAPCPYDGACPLYVPGAIRLVCGFSQRLQRPPFVRKTKHSGLGHEDVEYSYVVIRRGTRPTRTDSKVGRVGLVGETEKARENERQHPRELVWHDEHEALSPQAAGIADSTSVTYKRPQTDEDLEIALRQEAYYWPRLVFAPLKSGHIILDSCTAEGMNFSYIEHP